MVYTNDISATTFYEKESIKEIIKENSNLTEGIKSKLNDL
jgi:hypothetical protein